MPTGKRFRRGIGSAVFAAGALFHAAPAHAGAMVNLDVHWGFIPFGAFAGSGGTKGVVSVEPSGQADVVVNDEVSAGTKTVSRTVASFFNIVNSDPAVTGVGLSLVGGYSFFLQGQGDAASTAAIDAAISSVQLGISASGACRTTASDVFFLNHCAFTGGNSVGWNNLFAPAPGAAIPYEVSVTYDYTLSSASAIPEPPAPWLPLVAAMALTGAGWRWFRSRRRGHLGYL